MAMKEWEKSIIDALKETIATEVDIIVDEVFGDKTERQRGKIQRKAVRKILGDTEVMERIAELVNDYLGGDDFADGLSEEITELVEDMKEGDDE